MDATQDSLFQQAMARYQDGVPAEDLLGDFETITAAAPRQSAGWTCLTWLQLLCDQPDDALRSGRMAIKLNPQDPQARINLCLAMLETKAKGVRDHIDAVQHRPAVAPEAPRAPGLTRCRAQRPGAARPVCRPG